MAIALQNDSDRDSRSDDKDEDDRSSGFDGDNSDENASEESCVVAVDEKLPMSPNQAAAVIQGSAVQLH